MALTEDQGTDAPRDTVDIIGRDYANDVDAIIDIARANSNPDEVIHTVEDNADAIRSEEHNV